MIRNLALIFAFAMVSLATATTSSAQSAGICWAQYNAAVDACNGNSSCEGQASIDLGVCLEALNDSIGDCDPRITNCPLG